RSGADASGARVKRAAAGVLLALVLTAASGACAQTLPALNGEDLRGESIRLLEVVRNGPVALIVTFAKSAEEQARAWASAIAAEERGIRIVRIAVLEDVPGFFRGMVKSGMRRGVPAEQHRDFLLLFEGE